LRELYQSRDACKNVIYEITGISDVIRGASVASETATAQSIKSQWGSMRLKRSQAEVARYARDLMRIMLEIAAQNFNEQAWVEMTGLPFATTEQVQQAQIIMQQAQAFIASQPQLQQLPPDQLMQQIPPQYAQMYDQAQQTLAMPKWGDVIALLKNDFERAYRIDIETNSTVMPEATEDQQNITQAMDAMSRFIGEIMPLVQQGAMSWDVVKTWLKAMLRRYQFGNELEDYIDKMQQPQPPAPPPDHTLEAKQLDIQAKQQSDQLTLQLEQLKAQIQQQTEAQGAELQRIIEQGKAATEMRVAEMNINAQAELEAMRLAHEKELEAMRLQAERELALELEQIRVAGSLKSTAMTVNKQLDDDAALELSEAGEAVPKSSISDLVNAISQSLLVIAESNKQAAQANQLGLEALAAQIGKPKEVIRGVDGRVIGVQ
jgi:F0F1-type ATP synthase membrane subunit b/b'